MENLTDKEKEFFNNQVEKFKTFRKPNEKQRLLIALHAVENKTEDDYKKIRTLLAAEKKYLQAKKANEAIKNLLKADKDKERKALEHKKFVLGGGFWSALEKDKKINEHLSYRDLLQIMVAQKLINPIEKDDVNIFAEFLPTSQPIKNDSAIDDNASIDNNALNKPDEFNLSNP